MILKPKKSLGHEDGMHAMIDVVFLLLIYFMCTISFGFMERDLDADMSQGAQSESNSEHIDLEPILIYVYANGSFMCNQVHCNDLIALQERLKPLREIDDVQIIIDGEEHTPFRHIVRAMNQAITLNFTNISFAGKQ